MSDSTPAKVKCQDCGYLAVRNQQTRALAETEEVMRQSGEPPPVFVLPHPGRNAVLIYERTPVCFVREFDLPVEAGQADDARAFLNVIRQERVCPKWTQWFQGFTPRDHKEMIDAREQRDWQEARRREDIAYRDEQRRSTVRSQPFEALRVRVRAEIALLVEVRHGEGEQAFGNDLLQFLRCRHGDVYLVGQRPAGAELISHRTT